MGFCADGPGSKLVEQQTDFLTIPVKDEMGGAGLFWNAKDYAKLLGAW